MHWDYANKITPMVCAAYVKQIFIPLANNAANEMTPVVYADDTGHITI